MSRIFHHGPLPSDDRWPEDSQTIPSTLKWAFLSIDYRITCEPSDWTGSDLIESAISKSICTPFQVYVSALACLRCKIESSHSNFRLQCTFSIWYFSVTVKPSANRDKHHGPSPYRGMHLLSPTPSMTVRKNQLTFIKNAVKRCIYAHNNLSVMV